MHSLRKFLHMAAIAQLGERQTEDLKVPGSIPGRGGTSQGQLWCSASLACCAGLNADFAVLRPCSFAVLRR